MTRYLIDGHNGFGDSLHQRAPIRKMMAAGDELWLKTATPCIYHDLVGDQLRLVDSRTTLRSHARNAARERAKFGSAPPPDALYLRPFYNGPTVQRAGSVLAAMCDSFGVSSHQADFRLPIPQHWIDRAPEVDGPFIVYRPPVVRYEWGGAAPRNPDAAAYAAILQAARGATRVVSIADLQQGAEDRVGEPQPVDYAYERGELDFEQIAALVKRAALVVTTPGFMTVLAQAVGTPCITVFGGFERAASFAGGASYAPWLPIQPINPCACWSHYHACDKTIDLPSAVEATHRFVEKVTDGCRQAA